MKKKDLNNLLLELYRTTTAESQSVGARMTQLTSNSLFGLAIIFALVTVFLQLYETGILGFLVFAIFFLSVAGLFTGFIWHYWTLAKILRIHNITIFSIEILQREVILGKKKEKDLEREIIKLFPYLNLRQWGKKWNRNYIEKKGMEDLLKKLDSFN